MSQDPIVIIGTGLAGYTLAREVRKLDSQVPLRIVTADDGASYSKPMLSNAMSARKQASDLVVHAAQAMGHQLGATLLTHSEVSAIDTAERSLQVNGHRMVYDRLVLALGAQPIRLGLTGDASADVLSVNNLQDYALLHQHLSGRRRIAILGAGLIGCEFANDLAGTGLQVCVIDPAAAPLSRLLPAPIAALLRQRLEGEGVRFHLGTACVSVQHHGGAYRLWLSDGQMVDADLVLSAVGLRSHTELARTAGLQVGDGIVVDAWLRTSDPHVHALGDCAQVGGRVLPYVMPIMHAARALARTLCGTPTRVRYPAMPIQVKTPALPLVVAPPKGGEGHWHIEPDATGEDGMRALWRDTQGALGGFVLTGTAVKARQAMTQQLPAWFDDDEGAVHAA